MKQGSEHNPRQLLGLGLLSWKDHVKAIQAKAWLSYLDGSRGAWKEVLDQWVLKSYAPYGRGAILLKDPDKRKKMKVGCAPLPPFWSKALDTLDTLPIQLVTPTLMDKWQWRAEPVWYSHNFGILKERVRLKKLWEDTLELTKIGDMILGDRLWPREELENWIRRHEGLIRSMET